MTELTIEQKLALKELCFFIAGLEKLSPKEWIPVVEELLLQFKEMGK